MKHCGVHFSNGFIIWNQLFIRKLISQLGVRNPRSLNLKNKNRAHLGELTQSCCLAPQLQGGDYCSQLFMQEEENELFAVLLYPMQQ